MIGSAHPALRVFAWVVMVTASGLLGSFGFLRIITDLMFDHSLDEGLSFGLPVLWVTSLVALYRLAHRLSIREMRYALIASLVTGSLYLWRLGVFISVNEDEVALAVILGVFLFLPLLFLAHAWIRQRGSG